MNPGMSEELVQAKKDSKIKSTTEIFTLDELPDFDYVLKDDDNAYRYWHGMDVKKGTEKELDFSKHRGSGCSAIQLACDHGHKDIFILGFDMLGARQWEKIEGQVSRMQNNVYKNTDNYPSRVSMKGYLKFEWIYHLRQLAKYYKDVNFYYVNRSEYLVSNLYLRQAMAGIKNFRYGIYAQLKTVIDKNEKIGWKRFTTDELN